MRDKSKAAEDKAARLMESCAAAETSWDKEVDETMRCHSVNSVLTDLTKLRKMSLVPGVHV